jgi:hypothetical protein
MPKAKRSHKISSKNEGNEKKPPIARERDRWRNKLCKRKSRPRQSRLTEFWMMRRACRRSGIELTQKLHGVRIL